MNKIHHFFQVLEQALDNDNEQYHCCFSYFRCKKTCVFIVLIVFVHFFFPKVLPLGMMTTNDKDECNNVHCHLFFPLLPIDNGYTASGPLLCIHCIIAGCILLVFCYN
jgi:hypothetical protein